MAEQILARFTGNENYPLQWLPINGITNLAPENGTIEDLTLVAQNKRVILLLPASDVFLLAVELPIKSASQINKALPFMIEDMLADEIETYHLVWHQRPDNQIYIAATSHETFKNRLAPFLESGINLAAVYPETFCLPYENNGCSLLVDGENAILRSGQWLGGGIEVSALPVWIEKLLAENPGFTCLTIWQTSKTEHKYAGIRLEKTIYQIDNTLHLLQTGAANLGTSFNLLSGAYRQKDSADLGWRKWMPALGILVLAFCFQTGVLLKSYWSQKAELAKLEQQTLGLFKQTFPEVKRIVNIKAQAEQQLADLKNQGAGSGSRFLRLLYEAGGLLANQPGFQLQQLDFANDLLQLQLSVPDLSQLEAFKQQLENNAGLSVRILSADASPNALEAHLEIRSK